MLWTTKQKDGSFRSFDDEGSLFDFFIEGVAMMSDSKNVEVKKNCKK